MGQSFRYDNVHEETYCLGCGLVLIAPPVQGIVFPGFLIKKKKRSHNKKKCM